jgi:hypothetical protein
MKAILGLVVLAALGFGLYMWFAQSSKTPASGIRIGATVEEVEKVLGPAKSVVPQMGGQLRSYQTEGGRAYLLIFQNDELVEIQ